MNSDRILEDVDAMLNEMMVLLDRSPWKASGTRYWQGYMDALKYMLIARNMQSTKAREKGVKDAHLLALNVDDRLRK